MIGPVGLDDLVGALNLGRRELVSLVGGGGKTTVMLALGRQLGPRTVLTTTTKMGRDQTGGHPVLVDPSDAELVAALDRHRAVLVRGAVSGSKVSGVGPDTCDRWFAQVAGIDHVVVEADGARGRPFKAPAALEPVVPATATLLVSVVGADALGRVIADQCHRPMRVAALAGCRPSERLTPARAATALLHPRGASRARPPGARFAVVVNQVDDGSRSSADELVAILAEREPTVTVVTVAADAAIPAVTTRSVREMLR